MSRNYWLFAMIASTSMVASTPLYADVEVSVISEDGWAQNSVNATSFRKESVTSRDGWQFTGFYDSQARMVLAKRELGSDDWQLEITRFSGNARDAHNGVNLALDGDGYLHVSWDHHGHPLRYARGLEPYSLTLGEMTPMTDQGEAKVTYPQFFNLPDGRLLFMYRDGSVGNGNLVINRYDPAAKSWLRLHGVLIDGEAQRNAYWQAAVDPAGRVHVSWVWRRTGNVATNHDMAYARSDDGGETWVRSNGESYAMPINASTAEYAMRIPEAHELINQTSMAADERGRPYIVTYFRQRDTNVPQFQLIYHDGASWQNQPVGRRTQPFTLSGDHTRRIPVSRPQVVIGRGASPVVYVVYRDEERGSGVTLASCEDLATQRWNVRDIHDEGVGQWEPTFDSALWQHEQELHLFLQEVEQVEAADTEGVADVPATPVSILQWQPE